MGHLFRLPRAAAALAPRAFEDPRWAERHGAADPRATRDLEERALRMGAVALVALPRRVPGDGAASTGADCGCTAGAVCRHNNACPRRGARAPSPAERRP